MPSYRSLVIGAAICIALSFSQSALAEPRISEVRVTRPFFNPTIGQKQEISFGIASPGHLRVWILDRDGFEIRKIEDRSAASSRVTVFWDGRDDGGEIVPDESYSVRISLIADGYADTYDPLKLVQPKPEAAEGISYSRPSGVLSYKLASPSRIHIQAGQAKPHPKTGVREGPVLKTIVDRLPRVAGAVIESWNGWDDSGSVYIPDLPDFAIAVLATPLPANSILTVGNRTTDFVQYVLRKRPENSTKPRDLSHLQGGHHQGLSVLEDRSPRLSLQLATPTYSSGAVRLQIAVDSPVAEHFLAQPSELFVFVDAKQVLRVGDPVAAPHLSLPRSAFPPGERRVVVNWASKFGPVGIGVIKVTIPARRPRGVSR